MHVVVAFNDTSTDVLDIGLSSGASTYASALDLSSVGLFVAFDEANATGTLCMRCSTDTTIYATYTGASSNASTGDAEIVVAYIPDNDL